MRKYFVFWEWVIINKIPWKYWGKFGHHHSGGGGVDSICLTNMRMLLLCSRTISSNKMVALSIRTLKTGNTHFSLQQSFPPYKEFFEETAFRDLFNYLIITLAAVYQ